MMCKGVSPNGDGYSNYSLGTFQLANSETRTLDLVLQSCKAGGGKTLMCVVMES